MNTARRRLCAAAAVLALAACDDGRGSPAAAPLTPGPTRAPATTEPAATAMVDEPADRLAQLRASDAYLEFAEAERAQAAPQFEGAYRNFKAAWVGPDGRVIAEQDFANRDELWDKLVTPMRDSLLLAGPPYPEPSFGYEAAADGNPRPRPPLAQPYLRLERQLQEIWIFSAVYTGPDGAPRLRLFVAALDIDPSTARGEVVAVMEPFDLTTDVAPTPQEGARAVSQRVNPWVDQFPLPDPSTDIQG